MKKTFTLTISSAFFVVLTLLNVQPLCAQQQKLTKDETFSPQAKDLQYIPIAQVISENRVITPFTSSQKIYSLALSSDIELSNKASLVRIILIDENAVEHLVYETYPVIANGKSLSVTNVCEETSLLNGIVPASLQVQTINSTVSIKSVGISYTPFAYRQDEFNRLKQNISDAQNDAKIETINKNNKINGVNWVAARTDVSHIPYDQKKMLINSGILNLQGFEYYKGGIFVYDLGYGDSQTEEAGSLALTERWDWRERHGANKVGSPYYDGDAKKGGWFTAIQNQKCNQCWAFAPTAAIEVLTNLYFNQHLNIDLSEQNTAACGGGASGSCAGGNSSASANYIATTGVVNEACLPYANSDAIACSATCASPVDRIKAASRVSLGSPTEVVMKKYIMDYGPVTSGVNGMWHFMCLEGFFKDAADGKNVWIFKNSWGEASGDNGFANIKITGSGKTDYLYGNFAFKTPLTSQKAYQVACNDKDGDGLYNWGIGAKPSTCPTTSSNDKDADDSNPCIGPLDADYNETSLPGPNCVTGVNNVSINTINLSVFPNPTTGSATLSYSLPAKTTVRVSILNLLGEETTVLIDDKELQEGFHSINIDNLKSGVYFCKLSSSNSSSVKKVVVIK